MPEGSPLPPPDGTEYRIREAQSSDLDALTRLEASVFVSDRLSRKRLAALICSPSARLLACWRGLTLVGYALMLTRRRSRKARLYSIAVAPDETGRGIGSRLLAAIECAASGNGASHLRLEVRTDNRPAIAFYEKAGYVRTGTRPKFYEDGATALLYARALADTGPASECSRSLGRAA